MSLLLYIAIFWILMDRLFLLWDRELVYWVIFWAGLVSSLMVLKLRGVFLIMGLWGGPRLGGVWLDVYFRRSTYILHIYYIVSFLLVSIRLEQRDLIKKKKISSTPMVEISFFDLPNTKGSPKYLVWEITIFTLVIILQILSLSSLGTFQLKDASDLSKLTTWLEDFL
jgi:hypothetical protein